VLTKDEARRVAVNVVRLRELLGKADRERADGNRAVVDPFALPVPA
jgi:hypothetical protein